MTIPNMEVRGKDAFALGAPTYIHNYVLAAGTAQTVTIPTFNDANSVAHPAPYALFSANGDFYARYDGGTAAVPSGNVTDGTGSELNPDVRYVARLSSFSLIAPVQTLLSIAWYKG